MEVPHHATIPALLIAGATGMVALARSLAYAPSGRPDQEASTSATDDSVIARGSLSSRLTAGVKVRCLLTARFAPDGFRSDAPNVLRFERDGIIVGLRPTRGRYGYQDVEVVVANSDLPSLPASGWVVEKIA